MSTAKTTAAIRKKGETNNLPFITTQILSITVSYEVNKVPCAVITLKDGIPNKQDFPISNQDTFRPGQAIEILLGEPNKMKLVFTGIVTGHSLKVRKDKTPVLVVECKDEAVRLTIGRKSRFWLGKSDENIFKDIFSDYAAFPGLSLGFKKEGKNAFHDQITQSFSTDWDFIAMRAEALARYIFVDNGKVSVQEPGLEQEEALTLTYGAPADTPKRSRIWEFETEMDARYQFKSVQALGWDYAKQEAAMAGSDFPAASEAGNINSNELTSVIGLEEYKLHHHARLPEPELEALARAVKQKSVLHKVRGRVKFDGRETVMPGNMVLLEGVGDRFNGKVFVSRVFHTFQPGRWFTQIQFGLPFCWFHESDNIANPPAQGLLPPIKGLQIGTVVQVKDESKGPGTNANGKKQERMPDKHFRIKVNIAGMHRKDEGVWARLASFYATGGKGAVFFPEKDDEVVIGYIGEDGREPVILGALYSQPHPPPLMNDNNNYLKGIVTRNGHKLTFDEGKNVITVETNDGNTLILDDANKMISLKDNNANEVVMNDKGIGISSDKVINIKGDSINMDAKNISIQGSTLTRINTNPFSGNVKLGAGISLVASMADQIFLPPAPAPIGVIGPPVKNGKVYV